MAADRRAGILQSDARLGFRKGVIEIGVASSALMSDIHFHKAALLADLRREIRRPAISGISFRVAPIQECHEGPDRA